MYQIGLGQAVKMDDIPCAIILFLSQIQFSEACAYCADFDLDVQEIVVSGYDALVFFTSLDYAACSFFCVISNFQILRYMMQM